MSVLEDEVIQAVRDLTSFSVQTVAEAQAGENLRANILYNSSTRLQGNFSAFYTEAQRTLAQDITRFGINPTDEEKVTAYAYLIADLQQKKNPDWNAQKVDYGGDAVSREPNRTSYKVVYDQFLDGLAAPALEPTGPEDLQPVDHEDYPDSWRLSNSGDDSF